MQIEVGKSYTVEEMKTFFNVNDNVWYKKRDKLLKHLALYYQYHTEKDKADKRKYYFVIDGAIGEYESFTNESTLKKVRKDKSFNDEIDNVITEDGRQTAKNVSRIISQKESIQALSYKDSTIDEYTRQYMIQGYGRKVFGEQYQVGEDTVVEEGGERGYIAGKEWCKYDSQNQKYIPLSKEERAFFFSLFEAENKSREDAEADLYSQYQSGEITNDELSSAVKELGYSSFLRAQDFFMEKYKYRPIKVSVYVKGNKPHLWLDTVEQEGGNK